MIVYISGPMSGIPGFNFNEFYKAEEDIRAKGHEVINPARNKDRVDRVCAIEQRTPTWLDYLLCSLESMRHATTVAVLPGAENSTGATIELMIAERMELGIFDADDIPVEGVVEPPSKMEVIDQKLDRVLENLAEADKILGRIETRLGQYMSVLMSDEPLDLLDRALSTIIDAKNKISPDTTNSLVDDLIRDIRRTLDAGAS